VPINQTFNPLPETEDPIWSMSMVISESSAKDAPLITGGVEAVVLVFSPTSILIFVLKIVVPELLISTIRFDPVGATLTLSCR